MTSAVRAGLIGAGIGGASMFLLDPDRGPRRRALVRDKATWAARKTRDAAGATSRDVNNRLAGLRARVRGNATDDDHLDDARLTARVRAALGRVSSHPRSINVRASGGDIILTGDALEAEIPSIESTLAGVPGVQHVQNELTSHESPLGIPALQGGSERPGQWTAWARGSWSPTALLVTAAGLSAAAMALAASRSARDDDGWNEEEEPIGAVTEIDIVTAVPSEPGAFGRNEFLS